MYYGYYRYPDGYNITRDSSMIFPELKGGELFCTATGEF